MNYKNKSLIIALIVLLAPALALAQFVPLVGIPQLAGANDLGSYINALYALSISVAALLAVVKIIIAGVKWMLSDVVSSKQSAKEDIQGSLLGLLIVISAVLVLGQINPQLVATNLVLTRIDRIPSSGPAGGVGSPVAPLPPPASSLQRPADVSCTIGVASSDCMEQSVRCTNSGGRPTDDGTSVTCSYGNNAFFTVCPPNAAGQNDCSSLITSCQGLSGRAHTVNRGMSGTYIQCVTPF